LLKLPGGGGMGDPKARDPELVKRDVADGLITAYTARDVYGVEVK
jgi:N-methylhydantoinase B